MTSTQGEPTGRVLPDLQGERVLLRGPREGELERLASAVSTDPEASPWWGTDAQKILGWFRDQDAVGFVIDVDGETAGIVMYEDSQDPDIRYAAIDITLLAPWIGQGLGRDTLVTLARHLFDDLGHHRLTIDPSVSNKRAIRAYESVGFRTVGVMRRYERGADGAWHDGLLMDLLAEELASQ